MNALEGSYIAPLKWAYSNQDTPYIMLQSSFLLNLSNLEKVYLYFDFSKKIINVDKTMEKPIVTVIFKNKYFQVPSEKTMV